MPTNLHPSFLVAAARQYEAQIAATNPGARVRWDAASSTWQIKLSTTWQPLVPSLAAKLQDMAEEIAAEKLPAPQTQAQVDAASLYAWKQRARPSSSPQARFQWDDATNMWSDTDANGQQLHFKRNSRGAWVQKTWNDGRQTWSTRHLDDRNPADQDRHTGLDRLDSLTKSTQRAGQQWNEQTPTWWKDLAGGGGWASDLIGKYDFASPLVALSTTYQSVKQGADSGGQIVDAITYGIRSNTRALTMAGEHLAETLAQPFLRSLGRSGVGLQGLVGAGSGLVGSLGGILGDATTGGLKSVGGLVGGGIAVGGGALGAAIGGAAGLGVGAAPGWMVGMAAGAGAGAVVMKVFEEVADKIGGVLGAVGKTFGAFGEAVSGTLNSVLTVRQDATESGLHYAHSLLSIQHGGAYTGAGASSLLSSFGAFGMGPQEVAGVFSNQNALFTGARANMWGVGGLSMDGSADGGQFLSGLRSTFQGFLHNYGEQVGTMLGRNMLGSFGLDNAQMLGVMHLDDKRFNAAQSFSQNLGMNPEAAKRWGEDIGQLQNQVGQFVEYVKTQLGTAMLPAMQKGLELTVSYFKSHQKQITDQLWSFGEFLYADFPPMVMKGLSAVLGGTSTFLHATDAAIKAFANGTPNGFVDFVDSFVHGLDSIVEGLKRSVGGFQIFGYALSDATRIMMLLPNSIQSAFSGLGGWVLQKLGLSGLGSGLSTLSSTQWQYATAFNSPQDYAAALNTATGANSTVFGTGLSGQWDAWRAAQTPLLGTTAAGDAANAIDGWIKSINDTNQGWDSDEKRQAVRDLRDTASDLKEVIKGGIAIHTKHDVNINPAEDFLAKVVAYTTMSTWRKMDLSVGGG